MTRIRNNYRPLSLLAIALASTVVFAQGPAAKPPAAAPAANTPAPAAPAAAAAAKTPAKTPAKAKPKPGPTVINLPDAYPGMSYNTTVKPVDPTEKAPAVCVVVPALPSWLKLDCSDGNFKFTGTVPAVAVDNVLNPAMTVIDANNKQFLYKLNLTERPLVETIPLKPIAAAPVVPPAPTQADYDKMTLLQTIPIQEGVTQAVGQIQNVPAGAKLHLQVWSIQPHQPESQVQLVSPTAPPATVPQVDLKSNGYTVQFPLPLAAGQGIKFVLVTDDGSAVKTFTRDDVASFDLPQDIKLHGMKIEVEEPLIAGSKTITGKISPMPDPLVKPTAASGTTPATYGNVPGIVVSATDPVSKEVSQIAPVISGSPATFQSVNSDGTFSITLTNPLAARQRVRIKVVPPPGHVLPEVYREVTVITDAALSIPTISSTPFTEGTTVISGTATPTTGGVTPNIAVLLLKKGPGPDDDLDSSKRRHADSSPDADQYAAGERVFDGSKTAKPDQALFTGCLTADSLNDVAGYGHLLPLTSSSANTLLGSVDATAGTFKVTLAQPLKQDDAIQVVQVLPTGSLIPEKQVRHCASAPQVVKYPFEFHRTNLTFVAGVLLSNSSASSATNANFSQANQFYAFNADHAWRLPGYDCINHKQWGKDDRGQYGACKSGRRDIDGWHSDVWYKPGISTSFEARLTSIPVSTAAATTSSSTTSTSSSTSTLLTSQKVFRVETTAFLPWVISHGPGDHPNSLFLAPMAKVGFDTIAGASSVTNVLLPDGSAGTLNFQPAYNFYAYGARIGNMSLSASHDRAPLIEHYLDMTVGRYSNLQSYVCHNAATNMGSMTSGGGPKAPNCNTEYPILFPTGVSAIDSRKQLYRLDFEGLVKIPVPATLIPFYIGFNANIAQHSWQAQNLDHSFTPPDDIRILFGTKIDIGTLLTSFKLGAN